MIARKEGFEIGHKAETGELHMLGKKERKLLRAILSVTLKSKSGREAILRIKGKESLRLAKTLLDQMGGFWDVP